MLLLHFLNVFIYALVFTLCHVELAAESSFSNQETRAVHATRSLYREKSSRFGLHKHDFLKVALFIESKLPELRINHESYLPKEQTGLPCSIEYDAQARRVFILLPENKYTYIGKGKNKVVTKAIFYNKKPEIVARALQTNIRDAELQMMVDLQGAHGIMNVLGCTQYEAFGKKYRAIYSKLYSPGSLQYVLAKQYKFSIHEKMKIALNILKGLNELHKRNIVHRDVSLGNCLINIGPGKRGMCKIDAVIADFGRSDSIVNCQEMRYLAQGHWAYNSPEALFVGKLKGEDIFATDVYAFGCILYHLLFEKAAPWLSSRYVGDRATPESERYHALVQKINHYTLRRRDDLLAKKAQGAISEREDFEYLILSMLNPNPKLRISASELYHSMRLIIDNYKNK